MPLKPEIRSSSYESLIDTLQEGVYVVDVERRILSWNRGAEELTGYAATEVIGSKCSDNILRHVTADGCELCMHGCPLQATIEDGTPRRAEVYFHHKTGHRVPSVVQALPCYATDGSLIGGIEVFRVVNDTVSLLRQIEYLRHDSLTDSLTGLGNRRYLEEIAGLQFSVFQNREKPTGLLMVDIDNFKSINDRYGHLVGDRALQMVGNSLSGGLRPLDKIARYGGEEFVALCPGTTLEELDGIAERLRLLVQFSWLELENKAKVNVTVSIGGTVSSNGDDLNAMIRRADANMYECKSLGKNKVLVK